MGEDREEEQYIRGIYDDVFIELSIVPLLVNLSEWKCEHLLQSHLQQATVAADKSKSLI